MIERAITIAVAVAVLGGLAAPAARAQDVSTKAVLTFSRPVEIPGQVLPAGTYTFALSDAMSDRHIVQVLSADQSRVVAIVMTIPNYRLAFSGDAVITFTELPAGSGEALRAWRYPGSALGHELVYPRPRAVQLARRANAVVPATAEGIVGADALKTAALVAITPDEQELPVAVAIQTTLRSAGSSLARAAGAGPSERDGVPPPAQGLDLVRIGLFGLAAIAAGLLMLVFGRRYVAPAR